jgi:hypothetical protein
MFQQKTSLEDITRDMAYTRHVQRQEQKEIERSFARLFSSEEGKKVLAWLQVMTFHRAANADMNNDHLRYMEGQRALVASILRMIDRGQTS